MDRGKYNKGWGYLSYTYRQSVRNKCEVCGKPGTKSKPLHVDHEDGNKKNDDPDNLKAKCASCHLKKGIDTGQIPKMCFQYIKHKRYRRKSA